MVDQSLGSTRHNLPVAGLLLFQIILEHGFESLVAAGQEHNVVRRYGRASSMPGEKHSQLQSLSNKLGSGDYLLRETLQIRTHVLYHCKILSAILNKAITR